MTSRARGSKTEEKKGGTILTSTLREERRLEILYPAGTEFEGTACDNFCTSGAEVRELRRRRTIPYVPYGEGQGSKIPLSLRRSRQDGM